MNPKYFITAAIIVASTSAQSQISGKISTSSYSARNINPDYKEATQDDFISSDYFSSIHQAKGIHHNSLFQPILLIPRNHIFNPISLTRNNHILKYYLANVRSWIPHGPMRGGTLNYGYRVRLNPLNGATPNY